MADNIIKVNVTSNKQQRVTVSSAQVGTEITASSDTGKFWAQSAKNWAVSDFIVDNTDYSSKYYANVSKQKAQNSQTYAEAAQNTYNAFQLQSGEAIEELQTTKTSGIEEINTTKDTAIDSINSTKTTILNDIEFVADEEKKEIEGLAGIIKENAEEIANRTSFAMFDTILKDHVLTYEETKGLALQGTYVYKEAIAGSRYGYPDFYNKVIEEYNGATQTETINGVTVRVNSNGHKFYDIADKTAIDEFYNSLGLAWFYGVDTENERIFLPRDKYFAIKGIAPVVGNGISLGFTDGANLFNATGASSGNAPWFYGNTSVYGAPIGTVITDTATAGRPAYNTTIGITEDSSKSGLEAHLQANEEKYLYICVGNTTNYTGVTDVVSQGMEILEQVNQGIESRVKLDGSNAEFPYITQAYVNGTSGYNIYSNGYCEQWGRTNYGTNATVTVPLLKKMRDTDYYCSITLFGNTSGHGAAAASYFTAWNLTTTSFQHQRFTAQDIQQMWRVSGYLAEGEY